jgi:hypothetical protein
VLSANHESAIFNQEDVRFLPDSETERQALCGVLSQQKGMSALVWFTRLWEIATKQIDQF